MKQGNHILRTLGWVGVLGAALMFLSDCVMMDSSVSGAEFGNVAFDRLTESPNWRLTLGGVGGPIAACVLVVGFGHVYLVLQPGLSFVVFFVASTAILWNGVAMTADDDEKL